MDNDEKFFIDVLKILPAEVDCYIQAPSLEDQFILDIMSNTEYPYYQRICLKEIDKDKFIKHLEDNYVVELFQSVEIKRNNVLLFRGYDGVESGVFSKTVTIPNWFEEKYKLDRDYSISNDW